MRDAILKHDVQRPINSNRYGRVFCWLIPLVAMAGCAAEHRISLAEFLELEKQQEEQQKEPVPSAEVLQQRRQEISELLDQKLGPYRVGPGDILLIGMESLTEEGGLPPLTARVDRNGSVELPTVGLVKVADLELEDVEDTIRAAFVPKVFRDVTVHVSLSELERAEVIVTGAAQIPGVVELQRTRRNLLFALVRAGGMTETASGRVTLKRIRIPDDSTTLNLRDPEDLRDALTLPPLQNGDMVEVEAATPNMIFVGGLVMASQAQAYPAGVKMTILQAVAASGGLRTDVTPREGTLIRRMKDEKDVHVKLNMDRIAAGKDPNIMLAAGDVLWIPHTAETRIQDWINRNIFFRAGISTTANIGYNANAVQFLNSDAERSSVGSRGGSLEDSFDPFGFLLRNSALQNLGP